MPSTKRKPQGAKLTEYRDKRRASATAEPFGGTVARGTAAGGLFVVQQHRARHLHFDLRLEIDGVLRSWAVPKGPSANPADKRFAVLVEDHPLEYADFEGAIAPGNYGAGYVIVWDRGIWIPQNDIAEGWRKGKLLFDLMGHKLRGRWTLVRMHKAETEWLLIKERDGEARDAPHRHSDASILSGLDLTAAADPGAASRKLLKSLQRRAPKWQTRAVPRPMLATAGDAFDRPGWIFEFKYDGYRMFAQKHGADVTLLSRNAVTLTAQFPDIAKAVALLPYEQLLIDGELVVNDATGRPSFSALQQRAALASRAEIIDASRHQSATLYAFDLLEALGLDLTGLELIERKRILERVLPAVGPVRYSQHIDTSGRTAFAAAQRLGIEGIVCKRAASRYTSGRSSDWIKVRTRRTGDFVIVGWMPERSNRDDIGALILAEYRGDQLTPVGRVGSGLGGTQREEIRALLRSLPRGPALTDAVGATWVTPQQVCEVAFREYTAAGHLRQPVFVRLRPDKNAHECIGRSDQPAPSPRVDTDERRVAISHRDKVFYPELGFTKGDLIDYYDAISPWMLPYLKDRPLVLTRFPDGIHGKSFYQRDAPEFVPEWIRRETLWSEGAEREVHYFVADDAASLRYLVNLGTIPIHTWHARVSDLAHPDWCVLDLDPKDAPFASVIAVARAIRDLAFELELPAYLKTSGASGLHVLIPLANQLTHEQSRTFAHLLARIIVDRCGAIATIARAVRRRDRKVYIDYLQNGHGRLLVAPFCARAEPSAGVSMPLRWEELTGRLRNENFHIGNAVQRMRRLHRDPWANFHTDRADLARTLQRMTELTR